MEFEVLPNIIRRYKMKQQLIILWAFLALAYSAAIDTTISPFETDEEITTFLPNYDDAEELTELDQGKKFYEKSCQIERSSVIMKTNFHGFCFRGNNYLNHHNYYYNHHNYYHNHYNHHNHRALNDARNN